jgi:hypothetical protein
MLTSFSSDLACLRHYRPRDCSERHSEGHDHLLSATSMYLDYHQHQTGCSLGELDSKRAKLEGTKQATDS